MNGNKYAIFNREERYICSHLFRLLHKNIDRKDGPLGQLLSALSKCELKCDLNGKITIFDGLLHSDNVAIYSEVALIRDYLYYLRKDKQKLKQFKKKIETLFNKINDSSEIKYSSLLSAKPDLVITTGTNLLVFEIKFTQSFNDEQINRTSIIAEIWAKLLYEQLDFNDVPNFYVVKLGLDKPKRNIQPDIKWNKILEIAINTKTDSDDDRSLIAFENCINL